LLRILYSIDSYWTRSDFDDLLAIVSQTNRKWSAAIVSSTNEAIRVRVLDSCREFERDVEVCDCHCRYDLAVSNIDRRIWKIRLPLVVFDNSLVLDYEVEIGDVEVIECCCYIVMPRLMLPMRDLKYI
jgi:hypothetical protein